MTRELTPEEVRSFRVRLVETATDMFAELGPEQVSLRSLAARLGVSRSTPYRYFADLDEILEAVREAALRRLTDRCRRSLQDVAAPLERISATGRAYLDFALEEPNAFRVLFDLGRGASAAQPGFAEALREHGEVTKAPIREAVADGLMDGDPDEIARTLWAHVHGIASLHLSGVVPPGITPLRVWELSSAISLRGLTIDNVN